VNQREVNILPDLILMNLSIHFFSFIVIVTNNSEFPTKSAPVSPKANASVQIQRDVRPYQYKDATLPPLGAEVCMDRELGRGHDLWTGEDSILIQYREAIKKAKEYIYIENQHMAHAELLELLKDALERGVKVIYVVPGAIFDEHLNPFLATMSKFLVGKTLGTCMRTFERLKRRFAPPKPVMRLGETSPSPALSESQYAVAFLEKIPQLKSYENFSLCGLAVNFNNGYQSVYVHSKFMIVDDEWFTCGSANLVDLSLEKDHTELNASVWSTSEATSLRHRLFEEHVGVNVSSLTPKESFEVFQKRARENAALLAAKKELICHAYEMDPDTYGTVLFGISMALEQRANSSK
jgi:phosphatidylserine/phosphatidylglycerophosphate/cardiolipin synthase-like enzyme